MSDKKIIMAIDDDTMILRVYTQFLSSVYDLRIVKSAADAEIMLEKIRPDLILLDIEMPDISGFEFLHTIKKNPRLMKVPVVIVSSHYENEFVEHAKKGGASDVVAKPIIEKVLFDKINEAFKKPVANILGI